MKQFKTILKFELKGYLRNKAFVGVTLFLVILIAAVMFIPRIMSDEVISEGDRTPESGENTVVSGTDEPDDTLPVMLISAPSAEEAGAVSAVFGEVFYDYRIEVSKASVAEIEEMILSDEAECAFVFDSLVSYTYYVNNLGMYDMNTQMADEALHTLFISNTLISAGLDPEEAVEILSTEIDSKTTSLGKDQFENYFYTYIMIFALYMVILLYGQMVATNVASEKSSRAMEVLITSAKPTAMMFGKVISSCIAGFVQLAAIFGSAFLFYNINKEYLKDNFLADSIFNIPSDLLLYMLLFFVLGFLIYAFLYGAIGSTASKLEDINTAVMPLTFLFVIAFMVVVFSMTSGSVDNIAMKICSYIPFTSPMAMFTRIAMSTVAWYEIVISVIILIASVVGVGVLSAKIYRVGVLMYGTSPKLSNVIGALKRERK